MFICAAGSPNQRSLGTTNGFAQAIGLGTAANADWLFAITLMLQYA
jgi:hypothetical protein